MPKPPRRKVTGKPRAPRPRGEKQREHPGQTLPGVKIVSIAAPRLDCAAYHGRLGEFLRDVSEHTEAMDAAVLAHLLPAVGTLVGPGPTVYAGNDQPARLNCVVVGETNSGRKGTSAYPVDKLMELVDGDFWASQRVGGMSSGEGLIVKVANGRNAKGEDIPVEKRLYVLEEEFCRVLSNTKREGNILSHIIRQAFDSGSLSTLTVEPRYAFGAHISIVAHVTPDELAAKFPGIEAANGFGNRFLWFHVASDKVIALPKPIPDAVYQKLAPRLRSIAGMKHRRVELDAAAKELWEAEYRRLREDRPGMAGAITARGPTLVLRLALIYALVDQSKKPVIGAEHLKAGLAVWKYNCESAEFLFDSKTGDRLADRLYHLIQSNGEMTRKGFHRHLSNEQKRSLAETLTRLEKQGLIQSKVVKTKGRPKTIWRLAEPL